MNNPLDRVNAKGGAAIGEEALLHFIDEVNAMRARAGNRMRFRPQRRVDGVVWMQEYDEVQRPAAANMLSPTYGR